jgi:hypothetical protein
VSERSEMERACRSRAGHRAYNTWLRDPPSSRSTPASWDGSAAFQSSPSSSPALPRYREACRPRQRPVPGAAQTALPEVGETATLPRRGPRYSSWPHSPPARCHSGRAGRQPCAVRDTERVSGQPPARWSARGQLPRRRRQRQSSRERADFACQGAPLQRGYNTRAACPQ